MYLLNGLITEYATDPVIQNFRDTYDWYFLPVVNPDGYDYTWTDDRLWRKSRQPNPGSACVGADINRNFDFQWMTIGASDSPCSETYAGAAPNSEPEAQAISNYLQGTQGSWDLFWTLHTYGQLYMSPFGYTTVLPPNYPAMERVGRAAVQAIFEVHGERYQFGAASVILYASSGTSRDWAAGVPLIPFVYTLELRDENSFVLPPSQILPTGEEIWAGLKATVQAVQVEKPPTCVNA
jgi:carboxypeptidase A2